VAPSLGAPPPRVPPAVSPPAPTPLRPRRLRAQRGGRPRAGGAQAGAGPDRPGPRLLGPLRRPMRRLLRRRDMQLRRPRHRGLAAGPQALGNPAAGGGRAALAPGAVPLHYNGIKGPIPREIGKLSELTDLYLDVNHLTGPVPVEIAAIVNLQGEALSFPCLPLVSWVKSSRKDSFLIFFLFGFSTAF